MENDVASSGADSRLPAPARGREGGGEFLLSEPRRNPVLDAAQAAPTVPGLFTDQALWARVIRHARCAGSSLDPDQWFPVSADPDGARREAAGAIAVCTACAVRAQCLVLSLWHWDIGQHGVWGGLIAADRAQLRRRLPRARSARRGSAAVLSRVPGRLAKGWDVR